jgi:TRAP-type C4-dicarboxylate transport system permease small subunit
MLLVVVDVTMRYFGYPIIGVYDLVALGGAIVIGFSIPYAADRRVHVFMEMIQFVLNPVVKMILYALTRLMGIGISFLIGWNLIKLGSTFLSKGEASLTIQIVYYPIAYGLGACFFFQTLVYMAQFFQAVSGGNNE